MFFVMLLIAVAFLFTLLFPVTFTCPSRDEARLKKMCYIVFALHCQRNTQEAKNHRSYKGQKMPQARWQICQRNGEQYRYNETDSKAYNRRYQVTDGGIAHPTVRYNRDIGRNDKSDHS